MEPLAREQGEPLAQSRDELTRAASLATGMTAISIERELTVDDALRRIELHYLPLGIGLKGNMEARVISILKT